MEEMDLNDVRDIPPLGPLPTTTHGTRGRSDASLPPARKTKIIPVSTGKSLTDRFKELHRQPRSKVLKVQAARAIPAQVPQAYFRQPAANPVFVYSQAIKSMKQNEILHMEEMVVLQQEQRRKFLESQQLRLGNMRVVGGRPTVQGRTGLIGSINHLNTMIRNGTQAAMSSQIRTARSLNLRLGVANSNYSVIHIPKNDIMRGRGLNDRIRRRDFHRGDQGSGRSGFYATMKKKKFDSDSEFTSKDDLDNELDEYMAKARQSRNKLDKELEEYMAAAAAAKRNKNAAPVDNSEVADGNGVMDDVDNGVLNTHDDGDQSEANGLAKLAIDDGNNDEGQETNANVDGGKKDELMDLDW